MLHVPRQLITKAEITSMTFSIIHTHWQCQYLMDEIQLSISIPLQYFQNMIICL